VKDLADLRERLAQLFDLPILRHGIAPYQRDYLIETEIGGDSDRRGRYLFTFTHCVLANLSTTVRDDPWRASWDDLFIDYAAWKRAGEPDGFIWGTNWSMAYPGPHYVENSQLAEGWASRLGHPMHEAFIETEAFKLQLVFHDLRTQRTGDEVSVYDRVTFPIGSR
jgi:hypothetical protein